MQRLAREEELHNDTQAKHQLILGEPECPLSVASELVNDLCHLEKGKEERERRKRRAGKET